MRFFGLLALIASAWMMQTASAEDLREVRIELWQDYYSGAVSVLVNGSGGWPAGEQEQLRFETVNLGLAGIWGVAYHLASPRVRMVDGYRTGPVPLTLKVLRSEAGEFFVAVRGSILPVQFSKSPRCGGACDTEWSGTFTVEAPEYVSLATPTPAATPTPTPTPAAEEPQLTLTFEPSSTTVTAMDVYLESNHRIPELAFQMLLDFKGLGIPRNAITSEALEANEQYDIGWVEGRWENIEGVWIKTLYGKSIRHWACEEASRDYRLQVECSIERTEERKNLANVEEATLWYYIVDKGSGVRVYVRMDREWDGYLGVSLRFSGATARWRTQDPIANFCPSRTYLPVGVVDELSCGGGSGVGINEPRYAHHNNVKSVKGRGIYCQRHVDSDAERSVWACEPW